MQIKMKSSTIVIFIMKSYELNVSNYPLTYFEVTWLVFVQFSS